MCCSKSRLLGYFPPLLGSDEQSYSPKLIPPAGAPVSALSEHKVAV